ncbi:Queuosine Biosynthesis QueC ATPase [Hyphomicrobium sulfonivorans]|uniref:7-cyano-7-deazaguanine synthase n=1 Tax=Hyphomicrobium sulfonivorans TaxID=121290 RepID=A0A120CUC4_HYPSL|nr:7-cyano-7-deazaguanine synthase QueC [Hyphomicrobium sulfonivorans]KWT66027.1 Queuosine Biosynthesis QueC ATPase [Hyphomicrobium sulfonivorans]
MTDRDNAALVLFSGGQDSAVCLAWALERYGRVETLGFNYGQRHVAELAQRETLRLAMAELKPIWRERLGDDHMLALPELGRLSDTALTREAEIEISAAGLPSTFVPGRNLMFFTYAAALAYRRGIRTLVGGMCETDFSGYPDCRNDTLQTLAKALALGMDAPFVIETPLMWVDKAETWALTDTLGGQPLIDLIVEESHTCYLGVRTRRYEWGYGCNHCPACALRRKGWEEWRNR